MQKLLRGAIGFIGLAMVLVGLGFLFAPVKLGSLFYVEAVGSQGLASMRADFTGFFVGVGVFALLGAWTQKARPLAVPMLLLGTALFGRSVSLLVDGVGPAALAPMLAEAVMIAVLYMGWRHFDPAPV
jgi:hypothetical protein